MVRTPTLVRGLEYVACLEPARIFDVWHCGRTHARASHVHSAYAIALRFTALHYTTPHHTTPHPRYAPKCPGGVQWYLGMIDGPPLQNLMSQPSVNSWPDQVVWPAGKDGATIKVTQSS